MNRCDRDPSEPDRIGSTDDDSTSVPPCAVRSAGSAGLGTLAAFVAAAVIVGVGLSILAAQCPARVRLLGLFSLGWGALFGWLMSQLARRIEIPVKALALAIIAIVAVAGLAGITWQSFRREAPLVTNKMVNPLAAVIEARMRQSPDQVPDEVKQAFSTVTAVQKPPDFRDHLARRVRMLGDWSSPWPEMFWIAELVLGTSAAITVARRQHRENSPT